MARKIVPFTEEEKELIIKMYSEGIGVTQICREVESLSWRKPQTLYSILIKAGLYKKKPADDLRKFKIDDNYFDEIDTEHKAYWLGFLLADGYLVNSGHALESFGISLKSTDKYILEELKKDLNSTYEVKTYNGTTTFDGVKRSVEYSRFMAKSKKIFNRLKELGFSTNKSYTATLPLNQIAPELYRHLVRGYFDGDGGFNKASDPYHLYDIGFTGTYEVLNAIKDLLGKSNLKLSQRYAERDNNNYSLRICGDLQCYKIAKWMYEDSTIYLTRKYERYLELKAKYESNHNE